MLEICWHTEKLRVNKPRPTLLKFTASDEQAEKKVPMHDHMRVRHAQVNRDKLYITEQDWERLQYLTSIYNLFLIMILILRASSLQWNLFKI